MAHFDTSLPKAARPKEKNVVGMEIGPSIKHNFISLPHAGSRTTHRAGPAKPFAVGRLVKPFLRLAGCVSGPRDLSSRKGFSRSGRA